MEGSCSLWYFLCSQEKHPSQHNWRLKKPSLNTNVLLQRTSEVMTSCRVTIKKSWDTGTEINISNDWLSASLLPFSCSPCSLPVILCHLFQQIGLPVLWLPSAPAGPWWQPVSGVLPSRLLPGQPHTLSPWVSPDLMCTTEKSWYCWFTKFRFPLVSGGLNF